MLRKHKKTALKSRGFTVVELAALIVIGIIVLGIAIPKFIMTSHSRKAYRISVILNRLWDAQYEYYKEHKTFAQSIDDLHIDKSDLEGKWFSYEVTYATHDTFFVKATVRRPFGLATTRDWAGISSAKIRSISNPKTLGKYASDWLTMMKRDEKRRAKQAKKKLAEEALRKPSPAIAAPADTARADSTLP
jgi:type II secretory pathway pseudopilin PulG